MQSRTPWALLSHRIGDQHPPECLRDSCTTWLQGLTRVVWRGKDLAAEPSGLVSASPRAPGEVVDVTPRREKGGDRDCASEAAATPACPHVPRFHSPTSNCRRYFGRSVEVGLEIPGKYPKSALFRRRRSITVRSARPSVRLQHSATTQAHGSSRLVRGRSPRRHIAPDAQSTLFLKVAPPAPRRLPQRAKSRQGNMALSQTMIKGPWSAEVRGAPAYPRGGASLARRARA